MPWWQEDELVHRAQSGDRQALEELCQREWKPVYAIAYRAVRNVSDAQDITQEVFLRALRSLPRYTDQGVPFRAYLDTIARNLIRDRWRKRQLRIVEISHADTFPASNQGPEERALQNVDIDQLRRASQLLSNDHQTVLQLRIKEGLSAAEVGEIMDRSPAAIRQLQYRALLALREHILNEQRCRA